ncbi:MAG: hypothetical protein K6E54_10520, partial [Bacteroidaceae bacterium]|nr:hypothetical protein [Bacteroidaceae bacterium]
MTRIDTLGSLSVGNGEFAFTCDVTGLQTFPELYSKGVPLGTMSQWGWHSFPNTEGYTSKEALKSFDFGRGQEELYSCQWKSGREKNASDYLRANPHRLHLGTVGFLNMDKDKIKDISQTLDMWNGIITSSFNYNGENIRVQTSCDTEKDMVVARITDASLNKVVIRFPYPTGVHSDDACNWNSDDKHQSSEIKRNDDNNQFVFSHTLDGNQTYYINVLSSDIKNISCENNRIVITPKKQDWSLQVEFSKDIPDARYENSEISVKRTKAYWNEYWKSGAAVDFSLCTDPRAKELERRVVLSQYLLAIQCAGTTPPQET